MSDAHWKWRMEGGAIYLAEAFLKLDFPPDLFLTTDMLNVALFKSLLPAKYQSIPICLYFHENQLTYPIQCNESIDKNEKDYHYGFINYTSALVSDACCFNSQYNKESFIKAIRNLLKMMPDKRMLRNADEIESKASVLPVGIADDVFENANATKVVNNVPIILWNHRWEYDKNPNVFFESLKHLKYLGIEFQLIICGEHGRNIPKVFDEARTYFKKEIIHFDYVENRKEYLELLAIADITLITSLHEFFEISVLEACISSCIPILPRRLSYPKIFDHKIFEKWFYDEDGQIIDLLRKALKVKTLNIGDEIFSKYKMSNLVSEYDIYFNTLVNA